MDFFEVLNQSIGNLLSNIFKNTTSSSEMFNDHTFQRIPLPDVLVEANRLRLKGQKDVYAFTESIIIFMNYA